MPNPHDNIDQVIREALGQEDAALFDELGEQSLLEAVFDSFRSHYRWITFGCMLFGIVFMAFSVFCVVRFFQAIEVRDMLMYLAGFFAGMMAVMSIKVWYWMELNRNAISREIKRVEIQVAALAARTS